MGDKLRVIKTHPADPITWYEFWCPACSKRHVFPVSKEHPDIRRKVGNIFTIAFDTKCTLKRPYAYNSLVFERGPDQEHVCHPYLRNGKLRYLSDCTHSYRNKTVSMLDVDDWPEDK